MTMGATTLRLVQSDDPRNARIKTLERYCFLGEALVERYREGELIEFERDALAQIAEWRSEIIRLLREQLAP